MTKDEILAEGPHSLTLEELIHYLRAPTGITGDLGTEVCVKAANLLECYQKTELESGPGATPYTPKQPPKDDVEWHVETPAPDYEEAKKGRT